MGLFDYFFKRNKVDSNETDRNEVENNKTDRNEVESNKVDRNKVENNKTDRNEVESNKVDRNKVDPLSVMSFVNDDFERYTEEFTDALELSYKDFLIAVSNEILSKKERKNFSKDFLYAILDVAKKVEAETIADKEPESQRRLETYKEAAFKGKIQALNEYEYSLLSEVYNKYCLPKAYQEIAKEIISFSGASDISDNQQKLDAVATRLCEKQGKYEDCGYEDPYADKIYNEMHDAYDAKRGYERGEKVWQHINIFNANGLAAISKELGITDKNTLRDALINKYIWMDEWFHKNPTKLVRVVERTINGQYPGLSLKELKNAISSTKEKSNKDFFSRVYHSDPCLDFNFNNFKTEEDSNIFRPTYIDVYFNDFKTGEYSNMFKLTNGMLKDSPENNARRNVWKELGISLDETVADMVLTNGKKYVKEFFDDVNESMVAKLKKIEDKMTITQMTGIFKNLVVKNMSADVFRQNYPALIAVINDAVKSDPAKYEPMIADMKETAANKVGYMYDNLGLKEYLEDKDPWNSLHPTRVSTIVNDETYIAYERDKENTPTFYVFGTVDQKMLKNVNEVIADRLKTKGAPEGKGYHIVISDGKSEDIAYRANLGDPKSLSAITPSDENKETRQWLQPVVKYKVDNGYEKYPSKPKTQEIENTRKERSRQDDFSIRR